MSSEIELLTDKISNRNRQAAEKLLQQQVSRFTCLGYTLEKIENFQIDGMLGVDIYVVCFTKSVLKDKHGRKLRT